MDLSFIVLIGAGSLLVLLVPIAIFILIYEHRKLTTLRFAGASPAVPNYGSLLV